jgi:hypothetical protein
MRQFAAETGLTGTEHPPRRYLWTDAWAVCNYLGFFRETSEHRFLDLALQLVDQVHTTLGKQRPDRPGGGWLSGLPDAEAKLHPTRAGLRIGKPLNERQPGEPPDDLLEWRQDGQYFHYLTRWMHALDCVSATIGQAQYNRWGRELAVVAHKAFVYTAADGIHKKMYWKMSIDLSRPLVTSMGHQDPLDGLVTFQQLEATARQLDAECSEAELSLRFAIDDFSSMCQSSHWATSDELGMGSMLTDACKLAQLIAAGQVMDTGLLDVLLSDIETSLGAYETRNRLALPADLRLAFRELGLATGLSAIDMIRRIIRFQPGNFHNARSLISRSERLTAFLPLHGNILNFWLQPAHRAARSWQEHADINNVMLATALDPKGFLQLPLSRA